MAPDAIEYITVAEAAQRADVSIRTIYVWIKEGKVRTIRTAGGGPRIDAGSLFIAHDPTVIKAAPKSPAFKISQRIQTLEGQLEKEDAARRFVAAQATCPYCHEPGYHAFPEDCARALGRVQYALDHAKQIPSPEE